MPLFSLRVPLKTTCFVFRTEGSGIGGNSRQLYKIAPGAFGKAKTFWVRSAMNLLTAHQLLAPRMLLVSNRVSTGDTGWFCSKAICVLDPWARTTRAVLRP